MSLEVQILDKFSCFENLTQTVKESLVKVLKRKNYKKNNLIIQEEEPGPSMMFVIKGKAKVNIVSGEGKEIILSILEEGDFFGELAILTGENRSANVEALNDCEVLILTKNDLFDLLKKHSEFSIELLKILANRLRCASSRIADLALYDVSKRLHKVLLELANEKIIEGKKVHIIESRPTHQELASMIGTSREMVTRALKTLAEDEVIETTTKSIIICDI